jgi:septum formation protein
MPAPPLILASASPRRSELLRQLRPRFKIVPSQAAETHEKHWSAGEMARINACRKARAVSRQFPDAVIIGVDTLVSVDSTIFGKPRTLAQAARMLAFLQGRIHQVTTGVCLIHRRGRRQRTFSEQTDVTFRALTRDQIRRYHQKVNPLDKAGAYGIQEEGEDLVESISGSFSNVVGLPLEKLRVELEAFLEAYGKERRGPRAAPSLSAETKNLVPQPPAGAFPPKNGGKCGIGLTPARRPATKGALRKKDKPATEK